jgi:hypothetical protein
MVRQEGVFDEVLKKRLIQTPLLQSSLVVSCDFIRDDFNKKETFLLQPTTLSVQADKGSIESRLFSITEYFSQILKL